MDLITTNQPVTDSGVLVLMCAPTRSETVPSFVLLDVQEGLLTIYVYELLPSAAGDGEFELKVQELKHKKE